MKTIAIPECINRHDNIGKDIFLRQCGLTNVLQSTIYWWMKSLGFGYCGQRKTYYVDGHKCEDVVKYRTEFCLQYLTVYEPHCIRWVQMPKNTALQHAELKGCGFSYEGPDSMEMCEFHVDDLPDELISTFPLKMSVRAPPNSLPLIIIGQDECVFSQFLMSSKIWVGPNKEAPLLPESDGEGYMLSAMQSRDFGFGLTISGEKLALINEQCRGQNYVDTVAAMEVLGCIEKSHLLNHHSYEQSP